MKRKEMKVLKKIFDTFRLARNLRKAAKFAGLWNQDFIKRAFFNTLLNQIDKKTENTEKVT